MNLKNKVMMIVNSQISGAHDDLYRAKRRFHGMSEEELNHPYGQSGKTCGEILIGYKDKVNELEKCLDWVNNQQ